MANLRTSIEVLFFIKGGQEKMAEVVPLDDLKTMLCITGTDKDDLLNIIIDNTVKQARFKLGIKGDTDFPDELSYIPFQVSVRRYNRLKNEGMKSYSQEGESLTFMDDDFDDFIDDMNRYKDLNGIDQGYARAKWLNPYMQKKGVAK